ncbi:MAG TPA: GNAT family N-acetyltransferase [Vicinamibacterales bacterium]|nr:GNAT family N-acetyltransferase [Vicinamibacterales bacterium]
MDLSVRDAEPADAEALVGILNPIIDARIYTAFDTPFTVDAERAYIVNLPPRGIWKVAVRDQDRRVVGFQIMEPYASYTGAFDHVGTLGTYVDLDVRRQGVATRLFAATFEAATQKGYEKAFTFVRADNPAALQAYLDHGFVVVGNAKRQARIDGRYIDEILIEKWL